MKLEMVEIYSGKSKEWEGWHNLVLRLPDGDSKAVKGPIDPETSNQILTALKEQNNDK